MNREAQQLEPSAPAHTAEELAVLSDANLEAAWREYLAHSGRRLNLRTVVQRLLANQAPERPVNVSDLAPGVMATTRVGSKEVMLTRVGDEVYAIDNACGHSAYPLSEGTLEGHVVTCAWHGARIDVRTGEVLSMGVSFDPIPRFRVTVSPDKTLEVGKQL